MGCRPSGAIVLLSGGQDSTTALYWAKTMFEDVRTLSIHYGQRHWQEIYSADIIANRAGITHHEKLIIPDYTLKGGFLLEPGKIPVNYTGVAPTFVPGRNLLFLTIAANRAYTAGLYNIVIGVSQVDYSGYPDCRGEFIEEAKMVIRKALGIPIKIHTPLINLSKADTVRLAVELKCIDEMEYTHTCYNGTFPPCGECPACLLRKKGFEEAGIEDPLNRRALIYS